MKNIRVPYGMAVHDEQEIKAVVKTLRSSTQMGKNVNLFEKKISSSSIPTLRDPLFKIILRGFNSGLIQNPKVVLDISDPKRILVK